MGGVLIRTGWMADIEDEMGLQHLVSNHRLTDSSAAKLPFGRAWNSLFLQSSTAPNRKLGKYCTIEPEVTMEENKLLERIVINPKIFGGKPIIRGRRLAVEHVLGMLAAGDTPETILQGYPFLEPEDIRACLVYANRLVSHERVELLVSGTAA
jgi:uncharacterized protein (DUF433 family)